MTVRNRGVAILPWGLLLAFILVLSTPGHAGECWLDTPGGYQRIGGKARIGPYPDRRQCEEINQKYFAGKGKCSCVLTVYQPENDGKTKGYTPSKIK
jgi:hypothetical protein